jgi:hypothetical protein
MEPETYYRVHTKSTMDPIFSQTNSVHTLPPYICKINSNIILPFTLRSSKLSLSSTIPDQSFVCFCHLYHAYYVFRPTHPFLFDHLNIRLRVLIMNLLVIQFSPAPCYFFLVMSTFSPQQLVLKYPPSTFFPYCERPSFTPIKRKR